MMSPLISFSGETYEGPFYKQILEERKTQTCRIPRKRPIKKGDKLRLYWKVRKPKNRKPIHFIADAVCIKLERKMYGEFAYDDEFARRDGFHNSREMREWFGNPQWHGKEEYDVVQFKIVKTIKRPLLNHGVPK